MFWGIPSLPMPRCWTGSYLDMTTRLPIVDPVKLPAPVLLARGEYDGIDTENDLLNFFRSFESQTGSLQFFPVPHIRC